MEVFKPELCAFPLRAFVDATRDSIGSDALEDILRPYGVKARDLEDPTAWYSLAFVEEFLAEMVRRCPEPDHLERATRLGITPRYIGPFLPLVRALGSPLFAYQQLGRAAARFNRIGSWILQEGRPGFVRLAFQRHVDAPPQGPYFCKIWTIQLGLVPTLFDRAPGTVSHPTCELRGDPTCVYEVDWRESPRRRDALLGALFGVTAGAGFALQTGLTFGTSIALSSAAAIGGWGLGRLRVTRGELAASIQQIVDHNQALSVMTRANEDRYAELLEAKAEVDQKVAQRTRELQEATNQLSTTLNKLQELDRAKTDFFNNVSHELRSPLTLILAPLEELIGGRVPVGGQRAVYDTMHRNASRLLRLINQLLDLAKIDAGEMKLATVPTDLAELVRTSLRAFEAAAQKKGVKLSVQAPAQMTPVSIDPAWIESGVTNLVANALRLTNKGGGVRVIVKDAGTFVSLAVADDGPGIAPADQPKIFERFAQGEQSKRVVGGTGIGLALVRESARLHGGDVELVSELGKGSTFTIKLPRRIEAAALAPRSTASLPAPRELVAEVINDAPVQTADRKGPSPAAPLVLVVEDNPDLCSFIADVLAPQYRVRSAGDGARGVELARELRPDVIVSDVAMPEMDGYQLCRTLRADETTKSIPVLLVTARTDVSNVLEGFEAGASDYLLKPFHGTELLARVGVHVRLRRLTAQLARQERLAALGSLAASVAHNVRNPLSALISGLPAMRSRLMPVIDRSTDDLMGIMLDCAERIESMTLDLLDLSRIDREVSGDFTPGSGLLSCIRMSASQLGGGVELRSEVDDKVIASGRAGDMNHVFMNLLDNARRAVGPSGKIEIRGAVEGEYYVVTVGDSGQGIDPEAIDHIFEPFWTTRAAGEGTGLGLSIAREIVEEHGGSISAGRSELGGAMFVVRMPLRAAPRAVA
jgi:signal transduction histidine kinase